MRVEVLFDDDAWYKGSVLVVTKSPGAKYFLIVAFDDGETRVDIEYPSVGVRLCLAEPFDEFDGPWYCY